MLTTSQFSEIKQRTECQEKLPLEVAMQDRILLVAEVERLTRFVKNFSEQVNHKLDKLEIDMGCLETENERLRRTGKSSSIERDACVCLIAQFALALKMSAGIGKYEILEQDKNQQPIVQLQNRVIVDLPSGQVSWDYLDEEAHLFEKLPAYPGAFQSQTIQEIYSKILNPEIPESAEIPQTESSPLLSPIL